MTCGGLEVNIIHTHKGHGKLVIRLYKFLSCLDVKVLETNPIDGKEDLFRLVEGDMHQMAFLVLMIVDLEGTGLGLVEYNWSLHETILHRELIVWVDVDDYTIVGQVPRRRMPQHPFSVKPRKANTHGEME